MPTDHHLQLRQWFQPELPGPLVWWHVVRTGCGRCLVDRWPSPHTVIAETAGNYSLRGDPTHLDDQPEPIAGFVEAPEVFLPELRRLDPDLHIWERLVLALNGDTRCPPKPAAVVRRLTETDTDALADLAEGISWISKTHGGPAGLAASELGWGAFSAGRLASVAVPFFIGEDHEDLGVVTERAFRGRGFSTACAAAVVADVRSRGRRPTWTTSLSNVASLSVARRLGFRAIREDQLYIVRTPRLQVRTTECTLRRTIGCLGNVDPMVAGSVGRVSQGPPHPGGVPG